MASNRTIVLGRMILTTCMQAGAAPLLDYGIATTTDGRQFHSRVLLLTPWRRNQYGEAVAQRALVIGWAKPVWWNLWRPKQRRGPSVTQGNHDGFTEPRR